jgi:hypothetical protein
MSKKPKVKTNGAKGRPRGKELLRVLTALTTMGICNVRAMEAMYFHLVLETKQCSPGVPVTSKLIFWRIHGTFLILSIAGLNLP